jgi:hypothetical protein
VSDKTVAQKLQIKPGQRVLFVHAPPGYEKRVGPLTKGAVVLKEPVLQINTIQVFVQSHQELAAELGRLKALLAPKGALWVTYRKGSSRVKTGVNRDTIRAHVQTLGLEGVSIFALDADWSALRLKVVA